MTKPFLKWAGSKQKLLASLLPLIPESFETYREPFLGSASLFFRLRPGKAVLSDLNAPLIETYVSVRDNPDLVQQYIDSLPTDRDTYYRVRDRMQATPAQRAADFIYLNKLCWNGLYRVNLSGKFNVPYGANKTGNVTAHGSLQDCSAVLSKPGVRIVASDFSEALQEVAAGDFVFLDPPYVTSHNNNGFIEYNETIFSWADQEKLAAICDRLATIGASVLITNANHDAVRGLYKGFEIHEIQRQSTLASSTQFRRTVSEVAIVRRQ